VKSDDIKILARQKLSANANNKTGKLLASDLIKK
jgi:hypothetical protein